MLTSGLEHSHAKQTIWKKMFWGYRTHLTGSPSQVGTEEQKTCIPQPQFREGGSSISEDTCFQPGLFASPAPEQVC